MFDLVVSIGSNSKLASFVEVAYVMGKCCCTIIYENSQIVSIGLCVVFAHLDVCVRLFF